jgi:uncharacterized protein (TIGR00661 family)
MKKCIFFIQGEGRGHCTQAIALKQVFDQIGIEVIGVYIGKNHMQRNHDWVLKELNVPIHGNYYSPNFVYHNNKIELIRTGIKAIKNLGEIKKSINYIKSLIRLHKPDFVVNFYEPLVGTSLKKSNIPLYTIGHQFMIDHPNYPKQLPIQRCLISLFNKIVAGNSKSILALSYYPDHNHKNILVSPPLLRSNVLNAAPYIIPNKVTAYVVNSYLVYDLMYQAEANIDKNFTVYNETHVSKSENFECKKVGPSFVDDLLNSEYVICSGGFETICEAIYLNKTILAVPVDNHAEQILNTIDAKNKSLIFTNSNYDTFELFNTRLDNKQRIICQQFMKTSIEYYKDLFLK